MKLPASDSRPAVPGATAALLLLLAINMFNYVDRYVLASVEGNIRGEFFEPDDPNAKRDTGFLSTAFLLSYMVAAPVFGWLADRTSRWAIVGGGVIVWSLASGGSGLAPSYLVLLLTRVFIGIGEAAYGPAAPTLISDLYPVEKRGRKLAWFYMAIPVGSALGYVLGGVVAAHWHWRWAFYLSVPPGIALGIWALLMRDPPRGSADAALAQRNARWRDYLVLARTPSYVLNTLGMTAMTFALGGMAFWMPTYISEFRGLNDLAGVSTTFGGITVVTGILGTLGGGLLGDWLRPRWGGSYFLVSGTGMLVAFPFFLAALFVPFPYAWGFIFATELCVFLNTGPSNAALANVTPPAIRASAFAVNIFIIHLLGDAISPPLIGWVTGRFGDNMNAGFLCVSAAILLSGIFWLCGARFLARDTELAPTRLDN
jgi:MFS transporter, Spinster family, sphingosine-1-phosphate transporter